MDLNQIKELRRKTGVSISQCKEAIEESAGDSDRAIDILRKKGKKIADKKAVREIKSGIIEAYIHSGGKVGAMLELGCETDFVAKNQEFKNLAHDIVMHIAAMDPRYLQPEDIPDDVIKAERDIYKEQIKEGGKPENIIKQIIENKIKKYSEENSLITQVFIKNPDITIGELISEKISKMGENIRIRRFARYEV